MIDNAFLSYAASILADTNDGLSGSEICKFCNQYAVEYNKTIKYTQQPFKKDTSNINKAQALQENLACFESEQQFVIIRNLCDLVKFANNQKVNELKLTLIKNYGYLAPQEIAEQILETVNQVRHWLDNYPEAKGHYEAALEKKNSKIYGRNLLDDLRLSLESLIKEILEKQKSLENLKSDLGNFLAKRNINVEIRNFYISTVFDFFVKYQNERVKHNDLFKDFEVGFIFNQTTILMQFLITLHNQHS
ncbi:hypothetical protein E4T80_08700 [Muribacter muris]|uniref:Uncharacterized protein n=1 Tax=Muribacter muris TaxID=67855 RepID=A0A4Y9JTN6_9PAST|nr:hypothetical protein [Muribacter muris]MBF0785536.1 hypothetical protein [Muribacter muris]MBF0827149.1 hypothetical protein [Muribacter muris]TFV09154.1 hypothetical protein E4T80_08700 [Muribacter muris]